ncbi:unnamed protein product [Pleuronectes platessa]|uniref:Uncharacterized protein n=1 Tax=Pleuronectes platessa TaxID=8262 RepID=A0A9N7VE44_PLEPL|nr:unnamed protein product [Pleuronectes platessa]
MEESVAVSGSQPVDRGQARVRSSAIRAGQARAPLFLPGSIRHGQHGGHYKLMQLSASGPTPSITATAIPTQFRTRARSRGPWGRGAGRRFLSAWVTDPGVAGWRDHHHHPFGSNRLTAEDHNGGL